MEEPLILHLREKVESICLDDIPSSEKERKRILQLFHAMLRCLGPICKQDNFDTELNTILQEKNISTEKFCAVTQRLIKHNIIIPYSTRGLETRLKENGLTLNDLHFFDELQNEEQMYRYMQKLWLKVPNQKKASTFYKLLAGVVIGFSLLNYGILNPTTKIEQTELFKSTICPIKDLTLTAPKNHLYREDMTFNTLPYILWNKISLHYSPNSEMSKNEKIATIANLLLENVEDEIMMSIEKYNNKLHEILPTFPLPNNYEYSTRALLQKEFNINPNPELTELYWIHFINTLRIIRHGNIYIAWQENVLQWFHGHPLSNPELQPLLCELFQVFPECHDAFCYLKSIFFKKQDPQTLVETTQVELNQEITILKQKVELQKKQLIKYHVNEVQDLLPESRRRQKLKKYSSEVPFPASSLPHILLYFLDQNKRSNNIDIETLASNIIRFTEPKRIRINKSDVRRENWVYSSSPTNQMIDMFKDNWKEEKHTPRIELNEDPISFTFRMKLFFTEWDVEREQLNIKQQNDVREISELYQLNLVTDIYRTLRTHYGENIDVEKIFIQNSIEWVSRKVLSHPELEPLLSEIYDFDQILTYHGKFL